MPSSWYDGSDLLLDEASALAFLADCDMADRIIPIPTTSTNPNYDDMAILSDSSSSCTWSTKSVEKKKSWRMRRREEIVKLREEITQLSAELDELKCAAGIYSRLQDPEKTLKAEEVNVTLHTRATDSQALTWESIAKRQATLRQSSDDENAKLRKTVKHRIQQAKSLHRALKRKLRGVVVSPEMILVQEFQLSAQNSSPPMDNEAVFDKLKAGMDELYGDLDNFFQQVGMNQLPCPGRQNSSTIRGAREMQVEFLDSYAIPFDLRQTENAIWTPDKAGSEDSGMFFLQNFTGDNNTRIACLGFPFCLEGTLLRIVMRVVTRKYVKKNRAVFITRSLIESSIGPSSVAFIETTRRVLERGTSSSLGPTTVIKTHREAVHCGGILPQDVAGYPSLERGLKVWEAYGIQYNYALENKLIRTNS